MLTLGMGQLGMHWKIKSFLQNAVSTLSPSASYSAYYWMQKHFGGLGSMDPSSGFFAAIEGWKRICSLGCEPVDKVFLEVGTGRAPIVPLAYYLMGARKTITIDLHPYLKGELIQGALKTVANDPVRIRSQFGALLKLDRLDRLTHFQSSEPFTVEGFLDLCAIEYVAPADAAKVPLPPDSVDFHTSNTTLEHIPRQVLIDILREGARVTNRTGLFVHRVDYSDHFSHSDKSISPINFLQYSEQKWKRYASNSYMYMNRLRHDDMLEVFTQAGHRVIRDEPDVDRTVLDAVRNGQVTLAEQFRGKPIEVIATTGAWIITQQAT
jgi:hypothetical protein